LTSTPCGKCAEVNLFISVTNVHTGRVRVFPQDKVSADVIMASALPATLFQAVEIDGMPYWDGGYMGNPVLFPSFGRDPHRRCADRADQSGARDSTPHTQTEILNRVNEISFNSSLLAEFRAIDSSPRLIGSGQAAARHE